jgi:hypothetical protein
VDSASPEIRSQGKMEGGQQGSLVGRVPLGPAFAQDREPQGGSKDMRFTCSISWGWGGSQVDIRRALSTVSHMQDSGSVVGNLHSSIGKPVLS